MFIDAGCLKLCVVSGSDSAMAEDSTPVSVSLGKYILLGPRYRENEGTTIFQNVSTRPPIQSYVSEDKNLQIYLKCE